MKLASIVPLRYVKISGLPAKAMTNDDADRLYLCLRVLSDKSPVIVEIFNENCRRALSNMLTAKAEEEAYNQKVLCVAKLNT